ncbi:MAG: hypothetical protein U0X76_12890 [Bacteroidia bacterium]
MRILSMFLIMAVLLQSLSKLTIYAGYELNRDYITEKFCVNKSRPLLHCNGCCHLKKELNKDEREGKGNGSLKENDFSAYYYTGSTAFDFTQILPCTQLGSHYADFITQGIREGVFHPPSMIS